MAHTFKHDQLDVFGEPQGPKEDFFTPNRERLSHCIHMLREMKGERLDRGAGKSTAIAHMINWEIEDGPPEKDFIILCNTQKHVDYLMRQVVHLSIFLHPEYRQVSMKNNVITTDNRQRYCFFSAVDTTTERIYSHYQKLWGDITFSTLMRETHAPRHYNYNTFYPEPTEVISVNLVEVVRSLQTNDTKVFI